MILLTIDTPIPNTGVGTFSVKQRTFAISHAQDEKKILFTNAIGPCLSLIAYHPETKVGFLTHIVSVII